MKVLTHKGSHTDSEGQCAVLCSNTQVEVLQKCGRGSIAKFLDSSLSWACANDAEGRSTIFFSLLFGED